MQQLIDSIWREISASIAIVEIAAAGVKKIAIEVATPPPPPENPDPFIYVGAGDPNDPSTEFHGSWRRSELLRESEKGGAVPRLLTQMWVVATVAKWENEWRPAIAARANVDKNMVKSELFRDLRLLRNDVVHHAGISSTQNAGRCRLLFFEIGSPIHFDSEEFLTVNKSFDVFIDPHQGSSADPVKS